MNRYQRIENVEVEALDTLDYDELNALGGNSNIVSRYMAKIRAKDAQPMVKRLRDQNERPLHATR
jgi:hypothetical protein